MTDVRVDIKANFDTREATRASDSLTQNLKRNAQEIVSSFEGIQKSFEGVGKTKSPAAESVVKSMEGRLQAFEQQAGNQNFQEVARARTILGQLNTQLGRTVEQSSIAQFDLNSPVSKLIRSQIDNLKSGSIRNPQERSAMMGMLGSFMSQAELQQKRMEADRIEGMIKKRGEYDALPEDEKIRRAGEFEDHFNKSTKSIVEGRTALKGFKDDFESFNDKVQKHGRMLPAYIGTVVNTIGQAGQMFANLYAAERTMFDISSPQGMTNSLQQLEMFRTSQYWGGGSRIVGAIGGGIVGAMAAGPYGALAGTYLGSQGTGVIGDIMATVQNAPTEAQLKIFNAMYGKAGQAVNVFGGTQRSEFALRRFGEMRGIGEDYKSGTSLGYGPEEWNRFQLSYEMQRGGRNVDSFKELMASSRIMQIAPEQLFRTAGLYKYTGKEKGLEYFDKLAQRTGMGGRTEEMINSIMSIGGEATSRFMQPGSINSAISDMANLPAAIFGNKSEFGKLGEGGLQTLRNLSGLMQPKDEAQKAFIFRALRNANPNTSFMDINLMMREGIMRKGNLEAVVGALPTDPTLAKAYMSVMMPDASREQINAFSSIQSRGELLGRIRGSGMKEDHQYSPAELTQLMKMGELATPNAEIKRAAMALSDSEAGRKLQSDILDIQTNWNDFLNDVSSTAEAIKKMQDILKDAQSEAQKKVNELNAPPPDLPRNPIFIGPVQQGHMDS